jgi:hypothetical protein
VCLVVGLALAYGHVSALLYCKEVELSIDPAFLQRNPDLPRHLTSRKTAAAR